MLFNILLTAITIQAVLTLEFQLKVRSRFPLAKPSNFFRDSHTVIPNADPQPICLTAEEFAFDSQLINDKCTKKFWRPGQRWLLNNYTDWQPLQIASHDNTFCIVAESSMEDSRIKLGRCYDQLNLPLDIAEHNQARDQVLFSLISVNGALHIRHKQSELCISARDTVDEFVLAKCDRRERLQRFELSTVK